VLFPKHQSACIGCRFMERGTHSKEVLLRELVNLSECGQHPNIVQLRVRQSIRTSLCRPMNGFRDHLLLLLSV